MDTIDITTAVARTKAAKAAFETAFEASRQRVAALLDKGEDDVVITPEVEELKRAWEAQAEAQAEAEKAIILQLLPSTLTSKITLSLKGSDSNKYKFTPMEERTAKGILLHVGVLADLIKELTPAQQALVTPEIQTSVQQLLDDGADNFAQIVRGAYVKIESANFVREEEDDQTYETALDAQNWPTKRCHAAISGMLRRISVESKVLKQEQADAFWPAYTAKKVIRRARKV